MIQNINMATSSNSEPTQPSQAKASEVDELLTLADLAGITAPGNTMRLVIELIMINTPPQKTYALLRDILASKNRSKRVSSKQSSRRGNTSSDAVQENSTPSA